MRLVDDDRVAAAGDLLAPGSGLRTFGLRGRIGRVGPGGAQEALHDERELLQRRDDDLRAVDERRRELLRVLVDGLHHALGVLDLVDGVLQLAVEDAPVGDDDDAVEDLLVGGGVQAREAVREPRDAVRLAAARRVLDEVVAPRPVGAGRLDEPVDGVELVVAREDHRLALLRARALRVLDLLLAGLEEDVGAEDVEEALAFEHLAPEVVGAVAVGVGRVARAAVDGAGVAAAVERQEARAGAGEARRHVDLVGVGGEVDEGAPLEAEERRAGVAVLLVLADGVAPGLARHRVLELARRHRHAVEREDEVERVALARVARRLPRDGQLVAPEAREGVRVEAVRRREVREAERAPGEAEAVAQHVERALEVELPRELRDDQRLDIAAVQAGHARPLVGLRLADEGDGARGEQRPLDVPLAEVARAPPGIEEHRLDGGLEGLLGGVGGHGELVSSVLFACVIILARRSSR